MNAICRILALLVLAAAVVPGCAKKKDDEDPAPPAPPPPPGPGDIVVTSPNGGESFGATYTRTVTWLPGDAYTGNVDLDLSTDGGTVFTQLATDTPNDGSESVVLPNTTTATARIRVSATDGNPAVLLTPGDTSDANFAIIAMFPTVATLNPVVAGSAAWGDYDNDGDLDLALVGQDTVPIAKLYRNDAGSFTDTLTPLAGVESGQAAWGDFDNDGDLDLVLGGTPATTIYRNDGGGVFTSIGAALPEINRGGLSWGDYDNDGDLDLALLGEDSGTPVTQVFRNDPGGFVNIGAGLLGLYAGAIEWGDYDRDGDLDLAVCGWDNVGTEHARIYRNTNSVFSDIGAGLDGAANAALAWGDYDTDGDLDLVVAGGFPQASAHTDLYRNDDGTFVAVTAPFEDVQAGALAWGDYDGDGDVDLALSGEGTAFGDFKGKLYRNDGGTFTDTLAPVTGARWASLAWGDYDFDGDIDLAASGFSAVGTFTRVLGNTGGIANDDPEAPVGLQVFSSPGSALILWEPAADLETAQEGLTYNLRIGVTTSSADYFYSMAASSGRRRIAWRGPIPHNPVFCSAWIDLPPGGYFVSVQAIDSGMRGGAWSAPVPFSVP
jgi:hypothetical protein